MQVKQLFLIFTAEGVGKSSIVKNYVTQNFTKEYNVTIGVEFASKDILLDDGFTTKLQIWDAVAFTKSFLTSAGRPRVLSVHSPLILPKCFCFHCCIQYL
eukprot:TRINITY_DN3303_c0_g1_i7.p1 TRINITY_DN3303_c0_g1~~TRINITY_DN3303_c0_g1_i7.p1  ORF type:complete len:100 (-),score=2.12 TRINITY_DN3303_c0_g1_i7:470-769(-)